MDTFEEEPEIDLDRVKKDLQAIDQEIAEANKQLQAYFDELGV